MNLSRFFGATSREALRQVRLALGPDALIVSNRRVNGGVEILATDQTAWSDPEPGNAPAAATAGAAGPGAGSDPGDIMRALGSLRGALEGRFDELLWGNQLRRAPQALQLFQRLMGMGFSTTLLRAMLAGLPPQLSLQDAMHWCREELTAHLPVQPDETALFVPGAAVALVGPTGVGKTTTLAKLAARHARRLGAGSIVLVTTDTYRIGAHEQLAIYGRMLGVAVHQVQDAGELAACLAQVRADQLVLIDSIGVSQRDHYLARQAALLAAAPRPISRLLVLNAASHGDTLDEVARSYMQDGGPALAGCIVSKLDEATRLAPALDTAIRYRLPIHYTSVGQKVPQDLVLADAPALVEQALAYVQTQTLYAPSQADLAMLMAAAPQQDKAPRAAPRPLESRLPSVLAALGLQAEAVAPEQLRRANEWMDQDHSSARARRLWRGLSAPHEHEAETPDAVQYELAERHAGSVMLVLHGRSRQRGSYPLDMRVAYAHACDGRPMASLYEQWIRADGWADSRGQASLHPPAPTQLLARQIAQLEQSCRLPRVHIFDEITMAGLGALSASGVAWLAACAGTTRLQDDETLTTAAALSRAWPHTPDPDVAGRLHAWLPGHALWVGAGTARLPDRHGRGLQVRVVSARVLDDASGRVIAGVLGLSTMSRQQADDMTLAAWLLVQARMRTINRLAAQHWQLLHARHPGLAPGRLMAVAAQCALASWQVAHAPEAQPLREVLRSMGARRAAGAAELQQWLALQQVLDC